jgi:hypothetical protein
MLLKIWGKNKVSICNIILLYVKKSNQIITLKYNWFQLYTLQIIKS